MAPMPGRGRMCLPAPSPSVVRRMSSTLKGRIGVYRHSCRGGFVRPDTNLSFKRFEQHCVMLADFGWIMSWDYFGCIGFLRELIPAMAPMCVIVRTRLSGFL